jgi:ribosomal-protein-serine acetyltransferase
MLSIPSRAELRVKPVIGSRIHLVPSEVPHGTAFWDAIRTSRSTLEPWLPWVPFVTDLDTANRFLQASANDWDAQKALRLAIQSNHDHRLLGIVSIEALQPMHRSGDLGYWLMPSAVGHGVMSEACTLLLEWAFATCAMHRVRVAASTENARSLRVIERLGFQHEGVARHAEFCAGRWLDHRVYSMLETDPRPSAALR